MQAHSVYSRELYAITESVAKFRHYLLGNHFIIKTDHASLKHLSDQVMQTPEQEQCLPKLLGYNFTIEYRAGNQNQAADALSRLFSLALSFVEGTFMDSVYAQVRASLTIQNLKAAMEQDPLAYPSYMIIRGDVYWKHRLVIPADNAPLIHHILVELHSQA